MTSSFARRSDRQGTDGADYDILLVVVYVAPASVRACGASGWQLRSVVSQCVHSGVPTDLDCGDIPCRNFPVLTPDPPRLDGNHDGVWCET